MSQQQQQPLMQLQHYTVTHTPQSQQQQNIGNSQQLKVLFFSINFIVENIKYLNNTHFQ